MASDTQLNIDAAEVGHFDRLATHWWDPQGDFKTLHDINPLRLRYIEERAGGLAGKRAVDVGCGGGLLAEAMARAGVRVTGIDAGEQAIAVARHHLQESGLDIDYRRTTAEQLAATEPGIFDVVCCMELLEHVPEPAPVVAACARLARPGGEVFFSTINRNPKAYLLAIVGAEYLLRLVPRGTHDYHKFIRPSELDASGRDAGLTLPEIAGLHYNPLTQRYSLGGNVDVNYLTHLRREAETDQ